MLINDLAGILGAKYRSAAKSEQVLSPCQFDIGFARELEGQSLQDLCELAGLPRSYGTELSKARRLAPHVSLRQ